MIQSYFVCATPRTGSSLLLGLLESTGLAGRPESYFRQPDEQQWADRWGIPGPADPAFDYAAFVRAARVAGTTPNGIFGAKLMWGTLDEVVAKLAPDTTGADLGVLEAAFGEVRFVYLRREDILAQAVSWLRAEQTGTWSTAAPASPADLGAPASPADLGAPASPAGSGGGPRYDAAGVTALLATIAEHNAAWRDWFAAYRITPYEITYERLTADLAGTTRGVLTYLGLDPAAARPVRARHRRQGDRLNDEWVTRYRAEDVR